MALLMQDIFYKTFGDFAKVLQVKILCLTEYISQAC
jgi:hypothetical protein